MSDQYERSFTFQHQKSQTSELHLHGQRGAKPRHCDQETGLSDIRCVSLFWIQISDSTQTFQSLERLQNWSEKLPEMRAAF